jgi:hypothetical protein
MEVGIAEPVYLILPQAQLPSMAASGRIGSATVADIVMIVDIDPQHNKRYAPAPMLDVKRERECVCVCVYV